jgi:hypothetical protein
MVEVRILKKPVSCRRERPGTRDQGVPGVSVSNETKMIWAQMTGQNNYLLHGPLASGS